LAVFLRLKWHWSALIALVCVAATSATLFALTPDGFATSVSFFFRANVEAFALHDSLELEKVSKSLEVLGIRDPYMLEETANVMLISFSGLRYLIFGLALFQIFFNGKLSLLQIVLFSGIAMSVVYGTQISYNWTWAPVYVAFFISDLVRRFGLRPKLNQIVEFDKVSFAFVILSPLYLLPAGFHFPNTDQGTSAWMATLLATVPVLIAMIDAVKFRTSTWKTNSIGKLYENFRG
jgi:hypothetical protein